VLAEVLHVEPLPLAMSAVQIAMIWHVRRDGDPAHRWLRQCLAEAARS
jgi:DNA-binding transcriptional LysR family regulator